MNPYLYHTAITPSAFARMPRRSVSKATLINSLLSTLDYVSTYFMLAISAMSCPLFCVRYATAYMVENTAIVIGMYTLPFSEGKLNGFRRYLFCLLHRHFG